MVDPSLARSFWFWPFSGIKYLWHFFFFWVRPYFVLMFRELLFNRICRNRWGNKRLHMHGKCLDWIWAFQQNAPYLPIVFWENLGHSDKVKLYNSKPVHLDSQQSWVWDQKDSRGYHLKWCYLTETLEINNKIWRPYYNLYSVYDQLNECMIGYWWFVK